MDIKYVNINKIKFQNEIIFDLANEFINFIDTEHNPTVYIDQDLYSSVLDEKESKFLQENKINPSNQKGNFIWVKNEIAHKIKNNGFNNLNEYINGKKLGFLFGDIYYKAIELGYEDYLQYSKCTKAGYKSLNDYKDAINNGFEDKPSTIYYNAINKGFINFEDANEADRLGIETMDALKIYKTYENKSKELNFDSYDKVFFYKILEELTPNKKLSINKLIEYYRDKQSKAFQSRTPSWFTKTLTNQENIIKFLEINEKVKELGIYDSEGEVFERNKREVNIEKIIIDGSNVAWSNGNRDNGDKPAAQNIVIVLNNLKSFGIKSIECIVDASLKHEVSDKEIYEKLLNERSIIEAPAKSDADTYIIDFVKKNKTYVITNDTFRKDYYKTDEWVRLNIEEYRIPFMILDNTVFFDKNIN